VVQNRFIASVGLIAASTLLGAALRPPAHTEGLCPEGFWARKLLWNREYDVVLAGDSRVYRGLAPEVMADSLPGMRICNFGFSNCAFEERYLSAVEKLVPESGTRTIVLGITPNSLSERAAADNGFLQESVGSELSLRATVAGEHLLHRFRPYWRDLALEARYDQYREAYSESGWVATRVRPRDPCRAVDRLRRLGQRDRVSERLLAGLLARVALWRSQGIRVMGFRFPTTKETAAAESRLKGYGEIHLPVAFRAAGGEWIEVPAGGYECYDGSHLSSAGAFRLSRDLAAAIARRPVVAVPGKIDHRNIRLRGCAAAARQCRPALSGPHGLSRRENSFARQPFRPDNQASSGARGFGQHAWPALAATTASTAASRAICQARRKTVGKEERKTGSESIRNSLSAGVESLQSG